MDNMMNRKDVADLLQVSQATISNFVRDGKMPQAIFIGKRYWFRKHEILQLMEVGMGKPKISKSAQV